ncbi:hypothetical protein ACA910_010193 [Epithemia clementina (nom. ined.)]
MDNTTGGRSWHAQRLQELQQQRGLQQEQREIPTQRQAALIPTLREALFRARYMALLGMLDLLIWPRIKARETEGMPEMAMETEEMGETPPELMQEMQLAEQKAAVEPRPAAVDVPQEEPVRGRPEEEIAEREEVA